MKVIIPPKNFYLTAPEVYLPGYVSNEELLKRLGHESGIQTRVNWIEARTGIKRRPWASEDESTSDLALAAARKLLARMPEKRNDIGNVILATISGDFPSPPTAPLIQEGLGLVSVGAFDLGAACAGFTTALATATGHCLLSNRDQLLISADIRSKFLNPADLSTAILFGDAAAAVIVSQNPGHARFRIRSLLQVSFGKYHQLISVPAGGSRKPQPSVESEKYITMGEGPAVFLSALEAMTQAGLALMSSLGKEIDGIQWVVPHQANGLLLTELGKKLGIPPEKMIRTVEDTGNLSGASTPVALAKLCEEPRLTTGDLVLCVSAGGGGLVSGCVLEALS